MKFINSFAAILFFVAALAVSSFAQTGAAATTAAATGGKVAVLDTGAFADEKGGITRYVSAYKQLQTELKPRVDKLTGMQTRLQTIAADIQKFNSSTTSGAPVDPKSMVAKQEEGETLQLQLKQEKESYDLAAGKSYSRIVGPISADISRAMQEFAKQKGIGLILDLSKLVDPQNGNTPILALDTTMDVTNDFIKFFNARPAGTAATAATK